MDPAFDLQSVHVLNGVDWLLLGVIALSALMGLMRGLVVEVLSLVVWVAAFWLAFVYGAEAAVLFSGVIAAPSARLLLSYAVLFVVALLIGGIVTWLVGRLMKASGLGGVDRLLGLVFGLVRGAALACVLVLLFGFTTMPQDTFWRESRLLPEFQLGAQVMRAWLPAAVAQYVQFEGARTPVVSASHPAPPQGRAGKRKKE